MVDRSKWLGDETERGGRPPAPSSFSLREAGIGCLLGGFGLAGGAAVRGMAQIGNGFNISPAAQLLYAAAVLAGVVLFAVGVGILFVWLPSDGLRKKVKGLKPLEGRAREEFTAALGPASEFERREDGRNLATWKRPLYAITIKFDGDRCDGAASEKSKIGLS